MKGMRKNVWSEYKKVGLGDFVPKLGVALLAALIILSLAGCKNAVGGGVGSSGGGAGAGAGAGGSGNRAMYTFYDADGNNVGFARIASEVKFSEIKNEADTNSAISNIQERTDFTGWVDGDGNGVEDHHTFSKDTTFVATSTSSVLSKYIFKNSDGSLLGTTMLSGERSFGMIKSKVDNVSVVESVTGFRGWVVDGDTTLIKDENKYSSTTTFVAKYATNKADIDLGREVTSFVWYNEDLKETFVFDDQQVYIITGKDVKDAQATIAKYLTLEKLMYSASVTDPLYNTYKIEKEQAQAEITDEGVMWIAGKDMDGNDLVSLYTNVYYRLEDYNMDIAGRKLTRTTDGLVYVRQ